MDGSTGSFDAGAFQGGGRGFGASGRQEGCAGARPPTARLFRLSPIRNELEIDWDSLKCTEAQGLWHCKAKATMNTQPLLGPPVENPKLKRVLSIKASFKPVPVTLNTLDGLLVDFWDAKEPE